MLTQKQSSTTSLTNNNRGTSGFRLGTLAAAAALCTLFAGCGLAPGMRMTSPPTLVETSNDAGDPATEVNIPITPIDLSLVRKMRA
jgi:polysaccharide export outer membrane protein